MSKKNCEIGFLVLLFCALVFIFFAERYDKKNAGEKIAAMGLYGPHELVKFNKEKPWYNPFGDGNYVVPATAKENSDPGSIEVAWISTMGEKHYWHIPKNKLITITDESKDVPTIELSLDDRHVIHLSKNLGINEDSVLIKWSLIQAKIRISTASKQKEPLL